MTVTETTQDTHVIIQDPEQVITIQVDEILSSYKGDKNELVPILQQVQIKIGYLPEQAMQRVAQFLGLPESTIFGVATFYSQFKLVPTGRNVVRVCRGTACHVRGGGRILREVEKQLGIKPGESTPDLEYGLETVACIGACALAPTMVVNQETYGQMTTDKVTDVLKCED
ncbi:MAG: NADH-quinone oxidoreductase subunit NuoE [Chloroflexota bacterium]|nr:NADH-quinone oxidoreductase subunit NuoE [Chloroflexota bacterium]